MTWLNWQGVVFLLGVVALALLEVAVYDVVMYRRHGVAGTISKGVSTLGEQRPLFAALVGAAFVGGGAVLCVHWFDR